MRNIMASMQRYVQYAVTCLSALPLGLYPVGSNPTESADQWSKITCLKQTQTKRFALRPRASRRLTPRGAHREDARGGARVAQNGCACLHTAASPPPLSREAGAAGYGTWQAGAATSKRERNAVPSCPARPASSPPEGRTRRTRVTLQRGLAKPNALLRLLVPPGTCHRTVPHSPSVRASPGYGPKGGT